MCVLLRLLTGSLTIFEQTAINYSNHTVINNYAKQIVIDSRFIGMAVFETDKDIEIEFDWSDSDWTVVRIIDKDTGREIVSSQEPYSDDDDYDE